MALPIATRKTAFLAGMSLFVLVMLLGQLKLRGFIPYDADSPELFPFVLGYFLVTACVFVIGLNSFTSKALKTRIPMVYFPTNREGARFLFTVWGRMLIWFIGAVIGAAMFALIEGVLQ